MAGLLRATVLMFEGRMPYFENKIYGVPGVDWEVSKGSQDFMVIRSSENLEISSQIHSSFTNFPFRKISPQWYSGCHPNLVELYRIERTA